LVRSIAPLCAALTLVPLGCRDEPAAEPAHRPAKAAVVVDESEQRLVDEALKSLAFEVPQEDSPTANALRERARGAKSLPKKPDSWVALGEAWAQHARVSKDELHWQRVEVCADAALALAPDLRPALNLRALSLSHGHKFAQARDAARHILSLDARDAMALGTLSDALLELGDIEGAREAGQQMLDIKPNLPSYSRAAWLRWLKGDAPGALEMWRLAVDAGRGTVPEATAYALTEAANIFWWTGDLGGADKGLDMALSVQPGYGPALVTKGRIALAREEYKRAAELFEQADRFEPLVETAWLLEDARRAAGDETAALEAKKLVERRGRRDRRTFALYRAVRREGLDAALADIEREREDRGGPYTKDAHAWVLYRLGRVDDAKKLSDEVSALGTLDPRLLFHAGAILLAAGDVAAGRPLIDRALQLNPAWDLAEAKEARALLAGP
jgi:tetratricopeptide (TPR) repeat protein